VLIKDNLMVSKTNQDYKVYLVHFRRNFNLLDFCYEELESLAQLFGMNLEVMYQEPKKDLDLNPCIFVKLPSDDVCR